MNDLSQGVLDADGRTVVSRRWSTAGSRRMRGMTRGAVDARVSWGHQSAWNC